jgi:hypothetical protein
LEGGGRGRKVNMPCYQLSAIALKNIVMWKYMRHFVTEDSIVICSKVENEIYRLKTQERKRNTYWLVKDITRYAAMHLH